MTDKRMSEERLPLGEVTADEVSDFIQWAKLEAGEPGRDAGTCWRFERVAQILTRLSAAKEEAERERDEWKARAEKFYLAGIDTGVAIGEQNRRDGLA